MCVAGGLQSFKKKRDKIELKKVAKRWEKKVVEESWTTHMSVLIVIRKQPLKAKTSRFYSLTAWNVAKGREVVKDWRVEKREDK